MQFFVPSNMTRASGSGKHKSSGSKRPKYSHLRRKLTLPKKGTPIQFENVEKEEEELRQENEHNDPTRVKPGKVEQESMVHT